MYKDDTTNGALPKSPQEELDPTPDTVPDHYLNVSGVLPQGDKFAQGKIIFRNCDSEGNPIVRNNENPVLDTRQYDVEFGDGEITKPTKNMITESMYEKVDLEGNDTLLMDFIVDYKRNAHLQLYKIRRL